MEVVQVFWILLALGGVNGFIDYVQLRKNVSSTLDMLLATNNYDKRLRPSFGGPPVDVTVNILIRSMGPVSDNDQSFGLDCYFRQNWYDMRLQYQKIPGMSEFSLSWLFLDKVWKPDTYFVNGKKSYLHRVTAPNKFLRLRYDGYLTYSMRLTIYASCPMYLRKFPLDSQKCPLILGSYGYSRNDITYRWDPSLAVGVAKLDLAQFDLVKVTTENESLHYRGGHYYSTLQADFWLQRHTGFFMLQVYVPCGLIVLCSWVSFWIDPDDVAARVALGVTTVLSLTTMGFGSRQQLPKVSYWTALDWFVIICFTSVFSVMVEYACVNFIDKVTKDWKTVINKKRKDLKDEEEKEKKVEEVAELLTASTPARPRSASMSAMTDESPDEQVQRSRSASTTEIDKDLPPPPTSRKASLLDFSKKIKLLPRKLSATVKDIIDVPKIQDTFSKSIQNLKKLDRGFCDPDMTIPKVVVSSEDGDEIEDITVNLDFDEDWSDLEAEQVSPEENCGFFQQLKDLFYIIMNWKFLPGEAEVVIIMDDPDPPDKFSKIDIGARRGFPIAFFGSLLLYLIAFAYYLTDDFPEREIAALYKN